MKYIKLADKITYMLEKGRGDRGGAGQKSSEKNLKVGTEVVSLTFLKAMARKRANTEWRNEIIREYDLFGFRQREKYRRYLRS